MNSDKWNNCPQCGLEPVACQCMGLENQLKPGLYFCECCGTLSGFKLCGQCEKYISDKCDKCLNEVKENLAKAQKEYNENSVDGRFRRFLTKIKK